MWTPSLHLTCIDGGRQGHGVDDSAHTTKVSIGRSSHHALWLVSFCLDYENPLHYDFPNSLGEDGRLILDPCLELVYRARRRPPWNPLQKLIAIPLRRMFLYQETPQERIEAAVRKELEDLARRAGQDLDRSAYEGAMAEATEEACRLLQRERAKGSFPRGELEEMARGLKSEASDPSLGRLQDQLHHWIDKHKRLERRLRWLLDPELTRSQLSQLDPLEDADQLWCFVKYDFRPEFLYAAWGNAIERISQSESASTFFHATGAAEGSPLKRTEDTLIYYYYLINWGRDSFHGRKAVEGMNRIHGRYFIHNDGMKFVLLNAAFTVLDAFREIGHRPLTDQERLGYFHAQVNMGKAMNIEELSHSWDEMYGWFSRLSRSFSQYTPLKKRMWTSIEDRFDVEARVPSPVSRFRRLLEVIGMDESYRSALGFTRPTAAKTALARMVVRTFGKIRSLLPGGPYIESLQNFLTYPDGVGIEEVGVSERSSRLPSACPFSPQTPNRGYPQDQRPLMETSEAIPMDLRTIGWEEVRRHHTPEDLWVVFGGHVYDVSSFARNHPGGLQILLDGVGKDMTDLFEKANHSHLTRAFSLNFRIGRIESAQAGPDGRSREVAKPAEVYCEPGSSN